LVSHKFIEGFHLETDKHIADGEEYGRNIEVFVRLGEDVKTSDSVIRFYHPIEGSQTVAQLQVFECDEADAEKVFLSDDRAEKCKEIGHLKILSPDTANGKDRLFMVSVHFGKTQFEIDALDVNTMKTVKAKFDFLVQHE